MVGASFGQGVVMRPRRRVGLVATDDHGVDFKTARLTVGLTRPVAAKLLRVTCRTVRNWERGRTACPYAAFKLMRVMTGWELPDEAWRGWCVRGGVLWSPTGRGFDPGTMGYLSLVFSMARHWLRDRGFDNIPFAAPGVALQAHAPAAHAARRGARRGGRHAQRCRRRGQGERRVSGASAPVSRPLTPPKTNRGGVGTVSDAIPALFPEQNSGLAQASDEVVPAPLRDVRKGVIPA